MPRHQEYMPICAADKTHCMKEAMHVVEEKAFDVVTTKYILSKAILSFTKCFSRATSLS